MLNFNTEDASQICVGAFALAVPISFSEEAWRLGEILPWKNLVLLFLLSFAFLGVYTYQSVFQKNIGNRLSVFFLRLFLAYGITVGVVMLILVSLNKLPLFTDTILSVKRIVIISMPASMGAIVVDSFDKE